MDKLRDNFEVTTNVMGNKRTVVNEAEQFVKKLLTEDLTKDHQYHNVGHTIRVRDAALELAKAENCTAEEMEILEIACLFHDIGFCKVYEGHEAVSRQIATEFLQKHGYPEEKAELVLKLIDVTYPPKYPANLLEKIIKDADLSNLASINYLDYLDALRHEWGVFLNRKYTDDEWNKMNYKFINNHQFFTDTAKASYTEQWKANRKVMKKKRPPKEKPAEAAPLVVKTSRSPSKNISMDGLIGKNKSAQMMIKTSLRNHLDLAALADNKANIMLSVNALIITIVIPLAASYVSDGNWYLIVPMVSLLITCLASMVFATLATRPIRMEGYTNQQQIKQGRSNLFFFGNFYRMKYDDYEEGLRTVLAEEQKLDSSIMRDLYYLGTSLGGKYRQLRLCYTIFMWGIIVTVLAFGISYSMSLS